MNTVEFLQISSAVVPDRDALVEVGGSGVHMTYGEMAPAVARLANAMQGMGLERGDKVAVMAVNSANYVVTYYAAASIGVTFVPLNYRSKDEELSHMLNSSRAKALFVSDRYIELVGRIQSGLETIEHFLLVRRPAAGLHGLRRVREGRERRATVGRGRRP